MSEGRPGHEQAVAGSRRAGAGAELWDVPAVGTVNRAGGKTGIKQGSKAWTLVEMMVVLSIFAFLLAFLLDFFFTSRKQSARLDFRLDALRAAYLLRVRLADDLSSSLPSPAGARAVHDASSLRLRRVARGATGISGTCLDDDLAVITEDVTYVFDPETHLVYRNDRPIGDQRFLDVSFSYLPCGAGGCDTVELHAAVVPARDLNDPARTEFPTQEIISFTMLCSQSAARHSYPWRPPLY